MKKLLLLVGLVVFLAPTVVSAKENCFLCIDMPCRHKVAHQLGYVLKTNNDYPEYPEGWVKLNKRQCRDKLEYNLKVGHEKNENTEIQNFSNDGHLPTDLVDKDNVPTQEEINRGKSSSSTNLDNGNKVLIKIKTARDNGIITQDEFQKLLEKYFGLSDSNNNQTDKEITDAIEDVGNTIKTIKQVEIGACILDGNLWNILECL